MNKPLICLCSLLMSLGIAASVPSAAAAQLDRSLSPDASWDNRISPSFPGVDGAVAATTVFDGKLIVAGRFTMAGQTSVSNIAAWDGSSWSALGSGLRGPDYLPPGVSALAVFDGRLIAAGPFQFAGDAPAAGIAAWDGSEWSSLGSGSPNGQQVFALAVFGGKLIAGGWFESAGGTPAFRIAAWDGVTWTGLGSGVAAGGLYSAVRALAVVGERLIAGGEFTSAGGVPAHNIASWDGSSWSPLGEGRSSSVGCLAVYQDHVVAGGSAVASWDGSTWTSLGHDGPQLAFSLFVYGNRLIVGAARPGAYYLASWDGTAWTAMGGPDSVVSFTIYEDRLIAGGFFGAAGAVPARGIASWDGSSWSGLYVAAPGVAGPVRDLKVFRGKLIAGGEFTSAGDIVGKIAAWDGTTWSGLGSGIGNGLGFPQVSSLAVLDGRLVAGGEFREAGGLPAKNLAAWNGRTWSEVGGGDAEGVKVLTTYDDHLIVGHDEVIDCPAGLEPLLHCGVYAWMMSWDGATWSPLGEVDGVFGNFTIYDDHLIILTSYGIRVWNGTTWSPLGGYATGATTIYDGLLLVGSFRGIDTWDGSSWSPFETDLDGAVSALTVYDGQVIAGGSFTRIGGVAANHIAAWDGKRWSPLGSGTDGPVTRLAVYEGSLIVAGDFHRAGGRFSESITVWRKPPGPVPQEKPGSLPPPAPAVSGRAQQLESVRP